MHPLPPPRRPATDGQTDSRDHTPTNGRPQNTPLPPDMQSNGMAESSTAVPGTVADKKKRKHRAGRKKKHRRQSFAAPSETSTLPSMAEGGPLDDPVRQLPSGGDTARRGLLRRGTGYSGLSDDSMDSDALLDHRDHGEGMSQRPRRESRTNTQSMGASYRQSGMSSVASALRRADTASGRAKKTARMAQRDTDDEDGLLDGDERTPLMTDVAQHKDPIAKGYGIFKASTEQSDRRASDSTATSRRRAPQRGNSFPGFDGEKEYNVNNPPSVPTSPHLEGQHGYGDVMVPSSDFLTRSPDSRRNPYATSNDALIDIDGAEETARDANSAPPSPRLQPDGAPGRRRTLNLPASGDVCFPTDAMSDMVEEDYTPEQHQLGHSGASRRRNRRHGWPELWVLEDWAGQEKEERMEGTRAKRISEPVLVGGRLRPAKRVWHRTEEDVPYRYTYFNEEFESTIHAQTISELVQPGSSFRELFIPDPPEIDDSSSEDEDETNLSTLKERDAAKDDLSPKSHSAPLSPKSHSTPLSPVPQGSSRLNSMTSNKEAASREPSRDHSGDPPANEAAAQHPGQHSARSGDRSARSREASPPLKEGPITSMAHEPKPKRYGPRPTFWLDVMSPTDQEMRVLCKTFGIHALTSEDIMMQEAREKVELFRNYYFLNYRTFEQDTNSEDYLEPINMYVCVFRHGIISFHFSQIPHPANVRRRIRQLTDYLILSSDWISYAIIDDITDVYQPLIHAIEHEVDDIDEIILNLIQGSDDTISSTPPEPTISGRTCEKHSDTSSVHTSASKTAATGINLLRRIGETRKKVMSLYRLLGNKADVIKGFAKRCNEQWEVAPKSEIGLYLGDIQDHILTMTSNLSHYETLLSRAHSNYLAQINIRMNERQEQTADVLGKLTVVGTIVLPMNIICGMWGMNVKVPGQEEDNLIWFWSITAGLFAFGIACFYWCKRVYGIV